jgi:hypothetical protein
MRRYERRIKEEKEEEEGEEKNTCWTEILANRSYV